MFFQMLKSAFAKAPEPALESFTLAELECKLAGLQERIRFCITEIRIGSPYSSRYAEKSLAQLEYKEFDLVARIVQLQTAQTSR